MHLWFKYREKGENTLLPSSPPLPSSISLGGLGPTSPIFHPNGMVYFYLSRKISVKSSKMDHPGADLPGLQGKEAVGNIAAERKPKE